MACPLTQLFARRGEPEPRGPGPPTQNIGRVPVQSFRVHGRGPSLNLGFGALGFGACWVCLRWGEGCCQSRDLLEHVSGVGFGVQAQGFRRHPCRARSGSRVQWKTAAPCSPSTSAWPRAVDQVVFPGLGLGTLYSPSPLNLNPTPNLAGRVCLDSWGMLIGQLKAEHSYSANPKPARFTQRNLLKHMPTCVALKY